MPELHRYYEQDAQTFADWGCDYIKIDWCGGALHHAQQQQTEFSQALNNSGKPFWFELCGGYGYPPPEYVSVMEDISGSF